jgi:light-regulated signal transduction histidine kinase (bacteriophytochrome)
MIDCKKVVEEVIADMKASIEEKKAQVVVGDLPIVKGYNVELRLLFQNLISNAIKFRNKDIPPLVKIL